MTTDIDKALTPISQAQRMLAEAKTLPELRELRDFATGAKAWAKARGMGIEAENEAAEVILRSERRIGMMLRDMDLHGGRLLAGRAADGSPSSGLVLKPLEELGIKNMQSFQWQNLARIPDDTFERMLYSAREGGERLAKHNFYRVPKASEGSIVAPRPETPEDHDYVTFRTGAHGLLGWSVDEDGKGKATRNGLLTLPDDELRELATLVQALATAYGEARNARG